jgi:amino acid adenylation domain-containing protein/thioester reductase-like protein
MMKENLTIRNVLEMMANQQITRTEGLQLLKGLKHDNSNDGVGKDSHGHNKSSMNAITSNVQQYQPIAIIGMSGKFPDANDVNEYWDNLSRGKDSVKEIPETRWSLNDFYDSDAGVPNRSYSKWGGFLSDIDQFDPFFFNISPKEAELMDPQQRLFLQEAYGALEDAGYLPKNVANKKCGVFVGCNSGDYLAKLEENQVLPEGYSVLGNMSSILAARISYFLNLKGPSVAIDTACSSSLVAINLACESIRSGTSELALAGGVMMYITTGFYIANSKVGALSPDGKCYTFDHRANGFVPGEGVGVVVLKSLADALNDEDHIYGVIKGLGINQDGKTNGIMAPSAPSQTALECEVYSQYHIHPDTITYVEAHGTGTQLGDPIEIHALTDAFRKYTNKTQYCAIGSVKTNIGHTSFASGIASVIKLLLCLKHKKLVPSLHLEKENEHINFKDSPFYVNTGFKEWKMKPGIPRRAAISSFGFSGTNAHLVIEEYESPQSFLSSQAPQLIVLSAKNEARLQAYAKKIINFLNPVSATGMTSDRIAVVNEAEALQKIQPDLLKMASDILKVSDLDIYLDEAFSEYGFDTVSLTELSHRLNDKYFVSITPALLSEYSSLATVAQYLCDNSHSPVQENHTPPKNHQANLSLANLAYTLQVGREAMVERMAMVVSSVDDLTEKLTQYVQGQTEIAHCYRGNVKTNQTQSELLIEGEEGKEFLRIIIKNKKLAKLAQLWVSGTEIDWQLLYGNQKPQRISLPTYPFARERYWIPVTEASTNKMVDVKGYVAKLHPLLESNTSTFRSQQFTTFLTGNEFYLTDHVVGKQKTLPGVAYLEMARAAGELAGEKTVIKLTNIVWVKPIIMSDTPKTVHINLYPDQERVEFEVSTRDDKGEWQVHAQGKLSYESLADAETIDIFAIQKRCFETWDSAKCYNLFKATSVNHGPSFQTIQTLHRNDTEALSRLQLPLTDGFNEFILHPSIMDGALQTVIGLSQTTSSIPYLPFALGSVELFKPLSEISYAYVKQTGDSTVKKFNISIIDDTGQLLVRLSDFSVRAFSPPTETAVTMYYQNVWESSELPEQRESLIPTGTVLLFDTDDSRYNCFKENLTGEVILVTPGENYQVLGTQTYSINPNQPADYQKLLGAVLSDQNGLPSYIIHLWSQVPFGNAVLNAQIERSLFSIFHLSQALLKQKLQNPIKLLYVYLESDEALQPQYAAFSGFAKTIRLENSKLNYKTLALPALDKVENIILTELQTPEVEVRYADNQRWSKHLQEIDQPRDAKMTSVLKEHGVYLITGGAGGLGLIFADYLAKQFKAKLVLTGRSELSTEKMAKIQSFNQFGAEVIYSRADISKREEVEALIAQTKSRFGRINGIIHSAGVIKDAFVVKKTPDELAAVLAPKVYGTVWLDEATQNEPLDFFVLFSSAAATLGNVGQCDYAYANSFMDNFVAKREERRTAQKRFGKTLSINWSLWQEGGMQVDEQTKKWFANVMGAQALSSETGIEAFCQGLAWKEISQFMVLKGYRQKIRKGLGLEATVSKATLAPLAPAESRQLLEKLQQELLKAISTILKVSEENIDLEANLSKYGADSISYTMFANRINEIYHLEVTPTLFFEYVSIASLSQFLCQEYPESFRDSDQEMVVQAPKLQSPSLVPEHADTVYPLSHGQQALWFLYQLAPDSVAYNIALTLRIRSTLSLSALQNTFQTLINRHPCLRTTLTTQEGKTLQEVHQYQTVHFEQVDVSTMAWDDLNKRVIEAYQKPFDLEQGPLLRVSLFTRASNDHILLLTVHHIVFDGWSLWMLMEELGILYPIIKAGGQASLPAIKRTYVDYVHWQKDMLASDQGERLWLYWQKQLAGELPILNLPTDHPRPPVQTYYGASVNFFFTEALTQQLKELASTEGASLYMILLATYQILLYRYTGQEDILVGSATTGRTKSEFTNIAGYFVNIVVLRAKLQGSLTFKTFLEQVRQTVLGALDHQDYPFPLLVEHLQPNRDPSRSPLFQVSFAFQKPQQFDELMDLFTPGETGARVNLGELELEPFEMAQQEGTFDLSLEMMETKNALVGTFKYNTDLFEAATITRMVGHFQTLLEGIVANPLQPIHALPLLTEAEQQQLLAWNDTATDYPRDKTIVDLFEEQVKKTSDAIAVVFEDQQLTYSELNSKANQLAHYLQTLAVKPEVLVGICVERSIEMVIGLFGILKAGGAYVPLDPDYPQERLQFMLEDSAVLVLLSQSHLLEQLPILTAKVICLDSEWEQIVAAGSRENPVRQSGPKNLAYVIYTSGSTGVPKGVMVEHAAITQHVNNSIIRYQIESSDNVLQFASLNFDASIEQILSTWCGGARLVLLRTNLLQAKAIQNIIHKEQITIANLPPAYWQQLLQGVNQQNLESLKLLILGGETLTSQLAQQTRQILSSDITLLNAYGPTEATITATLFEVTKQFQDNNTEKVTPIGLPIANTQTYILDTNHNPTPLGIPCELCIGGHGLARGYLNRPELSKEKFIEVELFGKTERIYKTGDKARYLPDGNIEYLGRIDNQVKIRGFRIELGEIEAVLSQYPAVRETVVIVREDRPDDKRIVAYIVSHEVPVPTPHELRQFLKDKLPDYMIPSAFVTLEALPLTPNGKIDRQALSQFKVDRDQLSDDTFVAPRTSEEKMLASIWADVLGLEKVSIFDDFFELGGHSILATRLVSRIGETFATELPLHYLFQSPTIAGIAQAIEQARQADNLSVTTSIDLKNEAVLDPLIQTVQSSLPVPVDQLANPHAIFLTGATGFLGTYLLYELLEQTTADIYCLSRSSDADNTHKKLQSKLESYFLWQEKYRTRIIPVIGDLSKPLLGLPESQFSELSEKIDVIYHNGAWVNHIYPYAVLKAANVLGTQEVLRLAAQTKTKPVHFVSTLSIPTVEENDSPDQSQFIDGYVETKWVAEQLLKQAGERGLPVCIYRPSRITGHSQTGISNLNDIINLLIKGCIQLEKAPVFGHIEEHLTPVDYVSRAIVYLSQQPKYLGKSFDLINSHLPTRWHDLLFNELRALGYPLEQASYATWRTELSHQTTNALYPLLSLFPQEDEQQSTEGPPFDYHKTIGFQNTIEGLADTDIVCPLVDNELLRTYFSYFWNCGFLETP